MRSSVNVIPSRRTVLLESAGQVNRSAPRLPRPGARVRAATPAPCCGPGGGVEGLEIKLEDTKTCAAARSAGIHRDLSQCPGTARARVAGRSGSRAVGDRNVDRAVHNEPSRSHRDTCASTCLALPLGQGDERPFVNGSTAAPAGSCSASALGCSNRLRTVSSVAKGPRCPRRAPGSSALVGLARRVGDDGREIPTPSIGGRHVTGGEVVGRGVRAAVDPDRRRARQSAASTRRRSQDPRSRRGC